MPAGIAPGTGNYVAVCPTPAPGFAQCDAMRRTDIPAQHFTVNTAMTPEGYGPADMRSAYNLPSASGSDATVAIVDAFDDPTAESDLAVYRAQYGLPACTTANGCFTKVNQTGGTTYPAENNTWATEITLDTDAVSAICPNCHIVLVEASTDSLTDLFASENEAASFHPTAISNSWSASEVSSDISNDSTYFNHPGIAITASAGDQGYTNGYPADSPFVTAVGGTSLTTSASSRGWAETVWKNAHGATGSGCSAYEPKPSWQKDTGCALRTMNDVSMDADPGTGLAIYTTTGATGWTIYGGTSLSAPMIAGVYALADSISANGAVPASYAYAHTSALNDVTSGTNGSCTSSYLCTAAVGYDGPTGLGTPNGVTAFSSGASSGNGSNDFSVTLSPASASVLAGASTTSTVNTAVTTGAAQTVTLAESGAPAGVTASLSPASVAAGAASTLTLTTTATTAAGTYPITVTGTAVSGTHTVTYNLTVTTSPKGGGTVKYEAESATNKRTGDARIIGCKPCSGGNRVGYVGVGATLTFTKVTVPSTGTYQVVVAATQDQGRTLTAYISINGGTTTKTLFNRTASWTTVEDVTIPMTFKAGANTIVFSNPTKNVPDIDVIAVPQ